MYSCVPWPDPDDEVFIIMHHARRSACLSVLVNYQLVQYNISRGLSG